METNISEKLTLYKYNIITNPTHPEVKIKYNIIKQMLKPDDFIINSYNRNILSNGLLFESYEIYVPYEIIGHDYPKRLKLEELIYVISYVPIDYSFPDDVNIKNITEIIHSLLEKILLYDIDIIKTVHIDDVITFIPMLKNGERIYTKSNIRYNIDYEKIKEYELISDDTLTPYAAHNLSSNIDCTRFMSYSKLFMYKRYDNIDETINLIRNEILNLRDQGYISIPSIFKKISKDEIELSGEIIKQWDGYIRRINPILVARIETNFGLMPETWIENSINDVKNNLLPKYQFIAPSSWITFTRRDTVFDNTSLYMFEYITIISYLKTILKYPIMQETIESIHIVSKNKGSAQFPDIDSYKYFYGELKYRLNRYIKDKSYNIIYHMFDVYEDAIAFKWKLQSMISDIEILILEKSSYIVIFNDSPGIIIPEYKLNDINNIKMELIRYINENYKKFVKTGGGKNSTINMNILDLLSLFPGEINDEYVLIDKNDFEKLNDKLYINPHTGKLYEYSYGITYFKEMINGYFITPTKILAGIIDKFPSMVIPKINEGELLMNKYSMGGKILYNFEIAFSANQLYIEKENALLDKYEDTEIKKDQIELSLLSEYRPEIHNKSKILPSKDPGYIYPLMDLILPKNLYDDSDLYGYVKNIWNSGVLLSLWGKHIYIKTNKISVSFLNIPKFITESVENTLKSKNTILKLNSVVI